MNTEARLQDEKPAEFWEKVFWTDETEINLHQGKVWRPRGAASDPNYQ